MANRMTNNKKFDYVSAKAKYVDLNNRSPHYPLPDCTTLDKIIKNLLECENNVKNQINCTKNKSHMCYYPEYELYREHGKILVIKKRRSIDDPIMKLLTTEDSFDVFTEIHLSNEHCRREKMRKLVKAKYMVVQRLVDYFLKCCNICNLKKSKSEVKGMINSRTIAPRSENRKFLIDIYNMWPQTDREFKFILYCKEMNTSYLFLRPLMAECPKEISAELLKIIMLFGSPTFTLLNSNTNENLISRTVEVMKQMGLNHNIVVETCPKKDMTDLFDPIIRHLLTWMKETGKTNWGIGIHIVQWKINNTLINSNSENAAHSRLTPYMCMFRRKPAFCVEESGTSDLTEGYGQNSPNNDFDIYTVEMIHDYMVKQNMDTEPINISKHLLF